VKDLKAINKRFSDAFAASDFTGMGTANWDFHRRILKAAGSTLLERVLTEHWTASQRYRLGYKLIPGRAQGTIAEHARIIAAIGSGDPERARAAAREHIQRAGAELAVAVVGVQEA
jgi:DNA-binding GntR family transcriptional regulator